MDQNLKWIGQLGAALGLTIALGLQAVETYEARPQFDNLWLRPPVPPGIQGATSTLVFGGHVGPYRRPGTTSTPVIPASPDGKFKLVQSSFGHSFASLRPDYRLGEIMVPIVGADTGKAPLIDPPTGAFYAPSKQILVAADNGPVKIGWRMMDGTTNSRIYLISAVPTRRPARIFWTENGYNAPAVDLQRSFVEVHYNNRITNATPGLDPTSEAAIDFCRTNGWVNTVWVDKQGMLKARGCSGLFILEYFETGSKNKHIGYEIVEALEPQVTTVPATVGSRLLPLSSEFGEAGLTARIQRGLPDYVYHHTPQNGAGHFANWLYAIRPNGDTPWNIEIYWMRTGLQDVKWPYEVDWYAADWPDDRQAQLYVRGNSETNAVMTFPGTYQVELQPYQDPPKHATMSADRSSFRSVGQGRSLLRYVAGDDVWFQVIRSVDSGNANYFNRGLVPWPIGEELRPVLLTALATFDGSTSFLRLPAEAVADTTIEVWVKPARTNSQTVFYLADAATLYQSWQRLVVETNGVFAHYVTYGGVTSVNRGTTPVQASQWYHLAAVREAAGKTRLFVNGIQEGAEANVTQPSLPPSVLLFGRGDPSSGHGYFQGNLREVRVWSRVLDATEIAANMYRRYDGDEWAMQHYVTFEARQEGVGGTPQVFDLAQRRWTEWGGAVGTAEVQPYRLPRLAALDGVSSSFEFPTAGRFARGIEAWIRPLRTTNTTLWTLRTAGREVSQEVYLDGNGRLTVTSAGGTAVGQTRIEPEDWHHIAVVQANPGTVQIYLDGAPDGPSVNVAGTINPTNLTYNVGAGSGVRASYRGDLNEVRFWSRPLSAEEVANNMRRWLAVGEQGLLHHFTMEEVVFLPGGGIALRDSVMDQTAPWQGKVAYSQTPVPSIEVVEGAVGYIYEVVGTCYNPTLYTWPSTNSQVFAVNTNLLEVWWTKPHQQQHMAEAFYWPSLVVRYTNVWPLIVPELVIAGQNSDRTGLLPATVKSPKVYYQNDPQQPGYNPNEEHALILGGKVYAIRDDLNTSDSSQPYVLIQFEDLERGGRSNMMVFHVTETNAVYRFAQTITAGSLIQPPMPLTVLPACSNTFLQSGPSWRDRKLGWWSYAAADDGGPTNTVLRYYYPMQEGFHFPGLTLQPPTGAELPWLSREGPSGMPIAYTYTNLWPDDVPVLLLGESLVKPKHGLPAIAGQKSVKILYQQSLRTGNVPSVTLIDPTREWGVTLNALPGDVASEQRAGKKYFTVLPPHLKSRLFYDPDARQLKFRGEFVEPAAGEYYLLLNYLGGDASRPGSDRNLVRNLSTDSAWQAAVDALATSLLEINSDNLPFDSLSLSSVNARGLGYVTLAFNSSTDLTEPADPISLIVIRVDTPLYQGEVKAVFSDNPLDEKLTMRHSADFGGRPERYEFDWRYLPPDATGNPDGSARESWISFGGGIQTDRLSVTIGGPGLVTLSDNYFVCRYRPVDQTGPTGSSWSEWTEPMLAEGWIKRALNGINPFEQRIKNLEQGKINTTVSMVAQAGPRYVGDVPLNLERMNDFGLIEIYETVLRRGQMLSIKAGLGYNPANDALLLAAGRIHDLYMILGNEAYADALDPTIAYGTRDRFVYGAEAASIFCFMNQVPSLLDEELGLLRGRDASLQPDTRLYPVYNRLYWNFTKGMSGGEAAYALNYNLPNATGDVGGVINEEDAKKHYPQGHGDAWGHYLSAIKAYYQLLSNTNFTWSPRIEAKVVGGVTVSVDYYDERKFAEAAAAKARTGAEIVGLTYRSRYADRRQGVWNGFLDSNTNRAWGVGEWACRAGLGAYFDWAVGNSLLPDQDPDPTHTGIQKVDRGTVPELQEIATAADTVQSEADEADRGMNPLGLSKDVVPFDISPAEVDAGKTHFEQIYERALVALNNARRVLDHAQENTLVLRRQADSQQEFVDALTKSERDYQNRLVEIFGYPYSDDIGPGKLYPQGYDGPDLYHYQYVDVHHLVGETLPESSFTISNLWDYVLEDEGSSDWDNYRVKTDRNSAPLKTVTFNLAGGRFPAKPSSYSGSRRAEGQIQTAYSDYLQSWYELRQSLRDLEALHTDIDQRFDRLEARMIRLDDEDDLRAWTGASIAAATAVGEATRAGRAYIEVLRQWAMLIADAVAWGLPLYSEAGTSVGSDFASPVRAVTLNAKADLVFLHGMAEKLLIGGEILAEVGKRVIEAHRDTQLRKYQNEAIEEQLVLEVNEKVNQQGPRTLEVQKRVQALFQAQERFRTLVAKGQRLIDERTTMRAQSATKVQQDRYADMAFRLFRTESLGKYHAAFELAARYAYLAAKAYDYETGLLQDSASSSGGGLLSSIVQTRSLGTIREGEPQLGGNVGDPGLADIMARMKANWNVLRGRYGFNNPSAERSRFSLRAELFRIASPTDPAERATSDATWRNALYSAKVNNLLEVPLFGRYCLPFSPLAEQEPALVIPFSTTIQARQNFFGWDMAGGDNAYDSSHFATKIRSVGVWFSNFDNAFGTGLANEPRVYLIPVGADIMRSPSSQEDKTYAWQVVDQALPLPFSLSQDGQLDLPDWIPLIHSLSGGYGAIRKFPSLRAYHDKGDFDAAELCTNSRLVGRSVWNTQWLLIIPASTLHSDTAHALDWFINGINGDGNGVKDIKLLFQTYSYSGN